MEKHKNAKFGVKIWFLMQILNLNLVNFRNYDKLKLNFSPNKNIIIGNNGMGKTNIVEAIYVLALTKSFRGQSDSVMIKFDKDILKVEADIKASFIDNYKIIISKDEKRVKINNNRIKRLSDYVSKINVVLFSVDDLKLIKDTPSTRRKLINIELSQINNDYLYLVNSYNKLIKQRNSYLKTLMLNSYASRSYLEIITDKVIDIGLKIYEMRKSFINDINLLLKEIYVNLAHSDKLQLKYQSDFDLGKDKIKEKYKYYEEKDINFGKTHFGIHHDDFVFYRDKQNMKDYASEGEQKNAVIAFKLAELEYFQQQSKESPILILDDLFSELDREKINNILGYISKDVQTFITTTELSKVKRTIVRDSKVFYVDEGRVEEKE